MDSPTDHESPISNSSDDVPQDDMIISESTLQHTELAFGMPTRDPPSGSSSVKRRQPPGGFPPQSYSTKNRRREEGPVRRTTGSSQWPGGENRESGRTQKEELVDVHIVERLREGKRFSFYPRHNLKLFVLEWGDPFDDTFVKSAS